MQIILPEKVNYIIKQLNDNGYEAFIVGGCVRDSILKLSPSDWDITTNASPTEIKQLFVKTVDTGIKHGTVTIVFDKDCYEVTTYRIDGAYVNNRRPCNVSFTNSLTEDLSRRDFTMNAIAYHPSKGIVDPFSGVSDIKNNIIRTVGTASERFTEDALRMLRCIRFSAQLGFGIEETSLNAICLCSSLIKQISSERICVELTKTLVSDYPEKFLLFHETGLLKYFIKEFDICFNIQQNNPHHIFNVGMHSLKAVNSIEKNIVLRWTMLLHDLGKAVTRTTDTNGIDHFYGHPHKSVNLAEGVLKRLKFDNKSINKILLLIKYHDNNPEPNMLSVKKFMAKVGDDIFPDLVKIWIADSSGRNPQYLDKSMKKINLINDIYLKIKAENYPLSVSDLAINGNDLISMGFMQGKHIGFILNDILKVVIQKPEMNKKEALMDFVKSKYKFSQ